MRRKLLIGALSLLGLILLLAAFVFWYIRSGRLDLYLQNQVIAGLKDLGIRAEIGSAHLGIRGYKVTLYDVKLYAGDATEPFGKIKSIDASFSVLSYLRRDIRITSVTVDQPQIWIAFDGQGKINLDALHAPPDTGQKGGGDINFLAATYELKNAELHFDDAARKISAVIPNLNTSFKPTDTNLLGKSINHELTIAFDQGSITHEGQKTENINSVLNATVIYDEKDPANQHAEISSFSLNSDLANVTAKGNIESLATLKYTLENLHIEANLDKVGSLVMPDQPMHGQVHFDGTANGTGDEYHGKGTVASDAITAAGVQVAGLRVNTEVNGKGADYHATGEVDSTSLVAEGFRVVGVRVKTDVTGKGTEYDATANLATGAASGKGIRIDSIRVSDAKVKGKDDDFNLNGALALPSLKSDRVTVNGLRGRLTATRNRVSLEQFTANALGGDLSGTASLAYGGGSSQVDVQFKGIDLDQAATAAAAKDVKVHGTANGTAKLTFPATNFKAATGRIDAMFNASVTPPQSETATLPSQGEVALVANGHGLTIERAFVRSEQSEITATGAMDWNFAGTVDVKFKSEDMAEVQRMAEAFGIQLSYGKKDSSGEKENAVAVSGPGEFTGRIEGKLAAPNVTGHLKLENIAVHASDLVLGDLAGAADQAIGAFEGDIAYTPTLVRVENASLVREDGSRADFTINVPLKGENQIAIKANVQNFDLAAITRATSPGLADIVGRGTINGSIDLRGLPGPRTIEGTAKLTLSTGEFNLPSPDPDKESEKFSVPEFTGDITITNSELTVQNLRMRVEQVGDIRGEGHFNLDTYAYSLNAEGKDINLARVTNAISESVTATGTADVTVTGQGKLGDNADWSELNLNATIQGRNVTLNGRDFGDAKLTAVTENGLLKIEATGNILDKPRTLAATIDLRERKSYPVNANLEFTDEDIGPYLGLVSPELAGMTGRATGTIKLGGALLNSEGEFAAEQIKAVANLTKLEFGGAISSRQTYTIKNEGPILLTASAEGLTLNPVTFVGDGTSVTLEGSLLREGGARSSLAVKGKVDLRLISSFTENIFTTGIANIDASIVGKIDSPQLLGVATLQDIGVRIINFPISVARGNGQVRFTSNQAVIENFLATAPGGGQIKLQGGAALVNLAPDRWRVEANLDQISVEYPRDTQTVIDADITLQGNRRLQVLSGNVEVRRSAYTKDLTIDELVANGGPFSSESFDVGPGGGGAPAAIPTTLDIHITADNSILIKNNLADAVGSAYINLRGPVETPVVSGRILLSRGTIEFRRGRFELTRAVLTLPSTRNAELSVDIQSEADISGYHLTVAFSGPISKPETVVKAEPELAEIDIISLILTGQVSGERTALAAATQTGLGLAQSLLSASLSEQLQKGTQRLFGLSMFSIDPLLVGRGNDPTARITIGQRITKDLTVTYSQNLSSGPSGIERVVLVEYRLTNRFSVVGYRNDRGELGFDVRLRKRF
jgi:translocation and assembly module TamB